MSEADQLAAEQTHLDRAYRRLDAEAAQVRERLARLRAQAPADPTGLTERDGEIRRLAARAAALRNAEDRLCFGRIDRDDGERLHIGRTGVGDGDRRLVVDWRAPAAEPFYAATAREPLGLVRRRNLAVAGRRVVRVDDDLLDPDAAQDDAVGDGALLRALSRSRDGRMRDAVETLQAEQDAIVRAPLDGVLLVQGAPGTGKTVVALHRAAYLLYRSPDLLPRGVLIVGPNERFLDYIGDVLPALGETNVVTATVEDLYPGHRGLRPAAPDLARLLGDGRMAPALQRFLTGLQGAVGDQGHPVPWDGEEIRLPRPVVERCAEAARETRERHNIARAVFVAAILDELTVLAADAEDARMAAIDEGFEAELRLLESWEEQDADTLMPARSPAELAAEERWSRERLREELERSPAVQRAVDALWPGLTPEAAVGRFLREGLGGVPGLGEREAARLAATAGPPWTGAHVPLFDEAAELLGVDDSAAVAAAERDRLREVAFARKVLRSDRSLDGWTTAESLADRNAAGDHRGLAERASADRTWTYGHVIVDEAQDLTPMQWRMIARRCPSKSMTVVGDIAQTGAANAAATWDERLAELRTAPRPVELTVCYRSPRELVEAVDPLLRELRPGARRIDAVRASGDRPELICGDVDEAEQILRWAREERSGQRAIVTPEPERVTGVLADRGVAVGGDLRAALVVLPAPAVKGLEFDHVLVHGPDAIAAAHGRSSLYVALTRSTGTLTVVQRGEADGFGPEWERPAAGRP
ncbi:MAG TPA: AAA family ATPase [Glycomyces sp.]|nr:AAA family ATPase [Glycomyces sp.]